MLLLARARRSHPLRITSPAVERLGVRRPPVSQSQATMGLAIPRLKAEHPGALSQTLATRRIASLRSSDNHGSLIFSIPTFNCAHSIQRYAAALSEQSDLEGSQSSGQADGHAFTKRDPRYGVTRRPFLAPRQRTSQNAARAEQQMLREGTEVTREREGSRQKGDEMGPVLELPGLELGKEVGLQLLRPPMFLSSGRHDRGGGEVPYKSLITPPERDAPVLNEKAAMAETMVH